MNLVQYDRNEVIIHVLTFNRQLLELSALTSRSRAGEGELTTVISPVLLSMANWLDVTWKVKDAAGSAGSLA